MVDKNGQMPAEDDLNETCNINIDVADEFAEECKKAGLDVDIK